MSLSRFATGMLAAVTAVGGKRLENDSAYLYSAFSFALVGGRWNYARIGRSIVRLKSPSSGNWRAAIADEEAARRKPQDWHPIESSRQRAPSAHPLVVACSRTSGFVLEEAAVEEATSRK